jgi:hypothetical protein
MLAVLLQNTLVFELFSPKVILFQSIVPDIANT